MEDSECKETVFPDMEESASNMGEHKDGRFSVGEMILGRYTVLGVLGQGGMGVVYRCFDEEAGIEVALKALPPELSHNETEMESVKENFQLVHNLHHPGIASCNNLEKDKDNGNYYIVMESCKGESLHRWIRRKRRENGKIPLEEILPIVRQMAEALDYAHNQNILHRDVKPGNVLIDPYGKIKILDFGLAAQIQTSLSKVALSYQGTSGTAPYMAPEQWQGKVQSAAADQYALAVIVYEMLAGELPFESFDLAVLREAVLNDIPENISGVPRYVRNAVKRGLCKVPAGRFDCCSDFVSALEGKKIAPVPNPARRRFIKRLVTLILLVFVLLGIAAGGYCYSRSSDFQSRMLLWDAKKAMDKGEHRNVILLTGRVLRISPGHSGAMQLQSEAEKKIAEKERKIDYYLSEARKANTLEDWETVLKKTEEVLRLDSGNLPAIQLQKQAREEIAKREKQIRKLLSEAGKAKAESSWIKVLLLTGQVLKLDKNNAEAKNLQNETEAIVAAKIGKLLSEARIARDKADWKKVIRLAEEIRNWDATHKEAGKLWNEARKVIERDQMNVLMIKDTLSKARDAEKEKDWTLVKSLAEAVLKLDKNNAEGKNLLLKAEKSLAGIREKKLKIKKFIDEAFKEKGRAAWQKVLDLSKKALLLDWTHAEARSLQNEAEKAIRDLQIKEYLSEAEKAAKDMEWQRVLELTEKIIKLDKKHAAAGKLQKEARKAIAEIKEKERTIKENLSKAEKAKRKKDWALVKSLAEEILELEKDHEKAARLLNEAQKELRKKTTVQKARGMLNIYLSISPDDALSYIQDKGVDIRLGEKFFAKVREFPCSWNLDVGRVTLEITGKGILPFKRVVNVSPEGTEFLAEVRLTPSTAVFSSNRRDAEILVGERRCKIGTELELEPYREYIVEAKSRKQTMSKKIFSFSPGEKMVVDFTFPSDVHPRQKEYEIGMTLYRKEKYKDALRHLLVAAKARHPQAAFQAAVIYDKGLGMFFSSEDEALRYYRIAADFENPIAAAKVAEAIYEEDYQASVWLMLKYYLLAAKAGNRAVAYRLALIYQNGYKEIKPDEEKSILFLKQAAEQGVPEAMYDLGVRYKKGIGIPADSKKAVYWIRKAAENNHSQAGRYLDIQ